MPDPKPKPNQEKKKKLPLLIKILLIIIAFFFVSSFSFFFMPLRFLPFSLLSKLSLKKISFNLPKKQVIKTKKVTPITSKAVKKRIKAKEGGQLSVNHKGYNIVLTIPPNAFEEDTDVTLTPDEDDPLDDNDDDPGVTVDPPGPFDEPLDLDFIPGEIGPNEVVPDTSQPDTSGDNDSNQPDLQNSPLPSIDLGTRKNPSPHSHIILVTSAGRVKIIPTYFDHIIGSFGGRIDVGGDAALDDDPTQDDLEKAADQAAANASGACTDEFIQALMALLNYLNTKGGEASQAKTRYGQLLEECENQCLQRIENLCQTNRMGLRRQMFTDCWETIVLIAGNNDKAKRVMELKDACTASYEYYDSKDHPPSQGGVTLTSTLEVSVCGYVDDEWSGNYRYDTIAAEGAGDHYITAEVKFTPPPLGGRTTLHCSNSQSGLEILGTFMPINIPLAAQYPGNFNGIDTLSFTTYANIELNEKIKLVSNDCQ